MDYHIDEETIRNHANRIMESGKSLYSRQLIVDEVSTITASVNSRDSLSEYKQSNTKMTELVNILSMSIEEIKNAHMEHDKKMGDDNRV